MLVEPIIESGKTMSSSTQAKLPAGQETPQKNNDGQKSVQAPNLAELSKMASDIQKNLNIIHDVRLKFSVHKDTGRIVITVTDETTGKVIREIPPAELVEFSAKFDEMVGKIFNRTG
jgi:flagellar protein FlaG